MNESHDVTLFDRFSYVNMSDASNIFSGEDALCLACFATRNETTLEMCSGLPLSLSCEMAPSTFSSDCVHVEHKNNARTLQKELEGIRHCLYHHVLDRSLECLGIFRTVLRSFSPLSAAVCAIVRIRRVDLRSASSLNVHLCCALQLQTKGTNPMNI